jgi:hypothetical protein
VKFINPKDKKPNQSADIDKSSTYRLRAEALNNNHTDWVQPPLYINEQEISELTSEQIKFTLDYFSKIFNYLINYGSFIPTVPMVLSSCIEFALYALIL